MYLIGFSEWFVAWSFCLFAYLPKFLIIDIARHVLKLRLNVLDPLYIVSITTSTMN